MVIRVQTRNPIGPQIWSWVVVGTVIVFGLGTGVAFTTSGHPWIADAFYVFSAALFVAKFFTWEDVRQQELTRRQRANLLATGAATIILALVIAGNHHLNRSAKSVASNSAASQTNATAANQSNNESAPKLPSAPSSGTTDNPEKSTRPPKNNQTKPRPLVSSPTPRDKTEETNETKDDVHVKAQHRAPKDEVTAKVTRGQQETNGETAPAPSLTINNAPNGFAISGGNVNNPTVNNFGSPSRSINPDLRESLRGLLAKDVATVRVFAVNDMEANEFAQQLYDLLVAAGWTMKDKQVILVQLERPWKGVRVGYHGEPPADEKGLVSVPAGTPQAALVSALMTAGIEGISVNPKADLEEGLIELLVSSNPRHN